eukprot:COSAG01_NODE_3371_length_6179_cov_1.762336_7_plen_113_part_00
MTAMDDEGNTVLHYAVTHTGSDDIVAMLLNAGANPYAKDQHGHTAVMMASNKSHTSGKPPPEAVSEAQHVMLSQGVPLVVSANYPSLTKLNTKRKKKKTSKKKRKSKQHDEL